LGYPTGTYLNNKLVTVKSIYKRTAEGSVIVMSNRDLLFINGCYISKKDYVQWNSLGMGLLETSFCETGGNPITQGIMALPVPLDSNRYYMFYTDLNSAYEYPTGLYFPLAPLNLYYCIIDMSSNNGQGSITLKNQVIVADTLARGMIQATRNNNGIDWWIVIFSTKYLVIFILAKE
jgi:beta-xylosidase